MQKAHLINRELFRLTLQKVGKEVRTAKRGLHLGFIEFTVRPGAHQGFTLLVHTSSLCYRMIYWQRAREQVSQCTLFADGIAQIGDSHADL